MREVAQECREIQATYDDAIDKFNRSAREKFLDYMGQKKTAEEFNLPIEQFLQDDDSSEMRRKIQNVQDIQKSLRWHKTENYKQLMSEKRHKNKFGKRNLSGSSRNYQVRNGAPM